MTLRYAKYNDSPLPPAAPVVAGLYTGHCEPGAGWCPISVAPNLDYIYDVVLPTANPPKGAIAQARTASVYRPGNNSDALIRDGAPNQGLFNGFLMCRDGGK